MNVWAIKHRVMASCWSRSVNTIFKLVVLLLPLLTSSLVPLETMSYSTMPGLMTSTKSRTGRLLLILGSWKFVILLDLPAPCNWKSTTHESYLNPGRYLPYQNWKQWFGVKFTTFQMLHVYSQSSPCDHSRKRPALVATSFVKPHLNCGLNFVMKSSHERLLP